MQISFEWQSMGKHILSGDWGTSSFRLRVVDIESGAVLAETTKGQGIAATFADWQAAELPAIERTPYYRAVLQLAVEKLPADLVAGLTIYLSGMASSSIGMKTLEYGAVPFDLTGNVLPTEKIPADDICKHDILLVSGLKTSQDVMRGEETILLGCQLEMDANCLLIFPGTHSKHVWVNQNKLVDFSTFMTGEFFDLLSNKSILSTGLEKTDLQGYEDIFEMGVMAGVNGNLLNAAFHSRTNQLFNKMSPAANYQYLSGILLGTELKQVPVATENILLISGHAVSDSYKLAFHALGFNHIKFKDADQSLIDGHRILAANLK